MLFHLLPSSTLESLAPPGFAAVAATHRRPEQASHASAGRREDRDALRAVSKTPWQLLAALHFEARPVKVLYCCCRGTSAQVSSALVAPPEAPAREVLLLMMPSCFRTAAEAGHWQQQSSQLDVRLRAGEHAPHPAPARPTATPVTPVKYRISAPEPLNPTPRLLLRRASPSAAVLLLAMVALAAIVISGGAGAGAGAAGTARSGLTGGGFLTTGCCWLVWAGTSAKNGTSAKTGADNPRLNTLSQGKWA